jgi:hypothetical protein
MSLSKDNFMKSQDFKALKSIFLFIVYLAIDR